MEYGINVLYDVFGNWIVLLLVFVYMCYVIWILVGVWLVEVGEKWVLVDGI